MWKRRLIFDEVLDAAPPAVRASGGAACRWLSDRHVLVQTGDGFRIIDADDGESYAIPADRRVLTAVVFEQMPQSGN